MLWSDLTVCRITIIFCLNCTALFCNLSYGCSTVPKGGWGQGEGEERGEREIKERGRGDKGDEARCQLQRVIANKHQQALMADYPPD